jgi:hypothetical protein
MTIFYAYGVDFRAGKSSQMVDVPRFELGNRNAERIRCFILGFQVAQRLAAWQNTRYGGGL